MDFSILGSWWPLVILLLLWLLYLYSTWNYDYWKKRGVPQIKPLPFLGNVSDAMFGRKTLGEIYREIYWKLDGKKFGGIFNFSEPVLLVRDPELIKNILVKDFTSFHDNNMKVDMNIDPMFGRNPFVLRGDKWKVTRSQLMSAFTASKVKPLFPLLMEVCEELENFLEKNTKKELEVKEICARFTTNCVATCAFGVNGNAIKDPESEFRRMGRMIIEPTFMNNLKVMTVMLLPWLADIFRIRYVSKTVEDFFRNMVRDVVTYREKNNVTRADYMQHLINLKNKIGDNDAVNVNNIALEKNVFLDVDVAAQAVTFFLDGFETSSGALSLSLYCLATHPDVQTRVREEVNSVMKKYGGQLTYDGIQEMTYLDMVLSESLRIYPPVLFMTRDCTKPFKLETPSGGTYQIEVGTPVVIPVYALHNDPQYFPNPHTFDPERFNEENKKNINKYLYLPFGEGPRICLGLRFAQMQVKAGLAHVISNFEIRTTKRTPYPIQPDPNYFLFAAKGGLWMEFIKIK